MSIERGNGAPPKPGRLCTGSYGNAVAGDPFGLKSDKDSTSAGTGTNYASPLTDCPSPPLGTFHNTATQLQIPALVQSGPTGQDEGSVQLSQAGPGSLPMIGLHEKGRFFGHRRLMLVRRSGGAGSMDNTIGTPDPSQVIPSRHEAHSANAGERTAAPSFTSGQTLVGVAHADSGSRWGQVKKGAAG